MLARLGYDGEPIAACVTDLAEANLFFGKNLETGDDLSGYQTFTDQNLNDEAARHGMSHLNFTIASISFVPTRTAFDFDGDRKTDVSIFRPASGEWWYLRSSDTGVPTVQFGQSTDKIVPADFTGDGKTDIAFFRESTGQWFIIRSEDSSFYAFPFGQSGDKAVPADFDGDGKADPTVFRPSNATWYLQQTTAGFTAVQFGINGDKPVPAAYTP